MAAPLSPVRLVLALSLALTIAGAACTGDGEQPGRSPSAGEQTRPEEVDEPDVPAFRFTAASRSLVRTASGRIPRRHRQASARAAAVARETLTDLYVEAFLDPANWRTASYEDAFMGFARAARSEAEARTELLTAGARAGQRYDEIVPAGGRIATRILLDRAGNPTLLVSSVRFSADAHGAEPRTLRSVGQFFFQRVGGTWKIVSFHVTRADAPAEAA